MEQYTLEKTRMRSISPMNEHVRFFGKDITNISRRASPLYQNDFQHKQQQYSPKISPYDQKNNQKLQGTIFKYPQTYTRQSMHTHSNLQSHNPSPQPLMTRINIPQGPSLPHKIPNQQVYINRRNPGDLTLELNSKPHDNVSYANTDLHKSSSFTRFIPSLQQQNNQIVIGSNFDTGFYSTQNQQPNQTHERKTSSFITSEEQNKSFLSNLNILENRTANPSHLQKINTNQYLVQNSNQNQHQNQTSYFNQNTVHAQPVKITDSPQRKVFKQPESNNLLRSSLNTNFQEQNNSSSIQFNQNQNHLSLSGVHQSSHFTKINNIATQRFKNALPQATYSNSRQGSALNSLKNSYSNFTTFQDQPLGKVIGQTTPQNNLGQDQIRISKFELDKTNNNDISPQNVRGQNVSLTNSITPAQTLQNRAFEHFRNVEISNQYKDREAQNFDINPFEQSKKNAEKLKSRISSTISQKNELSNHEQKLQKIENLSHLWLDKSLQKAEDKVEQNVPKLNVPLLKKPSLDISSFNPQENTNIYQNKVNQTNQELRNQLQERLSRIDISQYLKQDPSQQEEVHMTVKLNKVQRGDDSQIQKIERIEEVSFLNVQPNPVSNELTFSADQLKNALQLGTLNAQENYNQSHVHTYAVKIPQEILEFKNYPQTSYVNKNFRRAPQTLEKYKVNKRQPGFKFKPEKLSSLAPDSTPSATLPIQNIWNDLIFKIVIFFIIYFLFNPSQEKNNPNRQIYTVFSSQIQPDLSEKMRRILIDWLIDVHKKFRLRMKTLFMAVNLIDRYLEVQPIQKHNFQLLGITCLLMASKYEEIYPPPLTEYTYVCADAYVDQDLKTMEGDILNKLNFNLVFSSTQELWEMYSIESKFIKF